MKKNNILVEGIKDNGGILIAVFLLSSVFALTTSGLFLSQANVSNLLNSFTTNCVLAFAMTCILIVGEIDLSVGSMVALSGVSICMLLNQGWGFGPALSAVLILGGAIGAVVGCVFVYTGMPSFVVTLAMQMVLRGSAELLCDGTRVSTTDEAIYNLTATRIFGLPLSTIIVIIICILLTIMLTRTCFGRHMYAIGGNRNAAIYSGIKVKKIIIITMVMESMLAAYAGVIVASRVTSGQPTAGQGYEGDAIAAAVLGGVAFTGGRGSAIGALLGALLMGIVSNGLNLLEVNSYWQTVITGLIIVIAVYIDTIKKSKMA